MQIEQTIMVAVTATGMLDMGAHWADQLSHDSALTGRLNFTQQVESTLCLDGLHNMKCPRMPHPGAFHDASRIWRGGAQKQPVLE
jgi:hypothetical protein